jgi:multidrug efflux system membrane fusion protein
MIHRLGCAWALALATLVSCKRDAPPHEPPAVPVRVATAARIDAPITVLASGVVEPMQTVNVEARTSGTISDVAFHEGDWVRAGQLLFRLDPGPLAAAVDQARAILARDEAQAAAAQHDAERYATLAAESYVTKSQAEQMHANALASAATVVADRAALRAATVNLEFATVRAPIEGRTGSVLAREGNLVGPTTGPLVVINQLEPILVRFPVLPQDIVLLRRGIATRPLPVTATGSDSSDATEVGQLSFLDNAIDSLTGTVTGKARFPNLDRRLWPGELVFLTVQAGVQQGVIAVPTPAVLTGQQGSYVYVVDPRTRIAQTRPVTTTRAVGELTIVARGLVPGDRVVVDGQSRLNPGSRVSIVGAGADRAAAEGVAHAAGGAGAATRATSDPVANAAPRTP